jgi:AraC-like DNA-binding protein
MYEGRIMSNKLHKHHFIEILFSKNDAITIEINNMQITEFCIIINSGVKHRCLSYNTNIIVLNIDPESLIGTQIQCQYLSTKPYIVLNDTDNIDNNNFIKSIISCLHLSRKKENEILYVVKKAIQYLNENISHKTYISDIAKHVSMSESRFQHIFKEQMNTPVSNYLQLLRIKKTISMLKEGMPINECVLSCGFVDCSHLNKVFKSMFGIAPSIFIKNSRIIQIE